MEGLCGETLRQCGGHNLNHQARYEGWGLFGRVGMCGWGGECEVMSNSVHTPFIHIRLYLPTHPSQQALEALLSAAASAATQLQEEQTTQRQPSPPPLPPRGPSLRKSEVMSNTPLHQRADVVQVRACVYLCVGVFVCVGWPPCTVTKTCLTTPCRLNLRIA